MQQIKLFDKNKPTCLGGCLISTGVLLFMGIIGVLGQSFYDEISPLSIFLCTVVVIAAIFYIIRHYDSGQYQQEVDNLQKKKKEIKKIADKYNALTADLKTQYQARVKSKDPNETKASIRNSFSKQYTQNKNEFEKERSAFVIEWDKAHPSSTRLKKMWQWGICIGFIVFLGACSFTFGVTMKPKPPQSPMAQLMESRSWNANNIPMPHMKDHSLYVSNPDSILLKETVDSINVILGQLDDVLGIESAMVIVGHIDNDDPVAMVRGIYEKYKVGRNNRGLVIVVGYLDHSYFIAPGRSLEADLTDLECNHLAQDYLIPSMKANDPNSGMLYLAHGVYALMSGKELPQMTTLSSSNQDDDEGPNFLFPIIYLLLIICWGVYASRQSEKLGWTNTMGSFLAANPFVVQRTSGGSSYSGHSSRSSHSSSGSSWSSGSSHSSGGYGGGSWGGGGSGGRW